MKAIGLSNKKGSLASLLFGAGDESRTRDLNLGKVALYQLSYSRILLSIYCIYRLPQPIFSYLHRICLFVTSPCSGEVRLCISR